MANNHTTLRELFTDIADAIREKRGVASELVADNFPEEIRAITTTSGGGTGGGGSGESALVEFQPQFSPRRTPYQLTEFEEG